MPWRIEHASSVYRSFRRVLFGVIGKYRGGKRWEKKPPGCFYKQTHFCLNILELYCVICHRCIDNTVNVVHSAYWFFYCKVAKCNGFVIKHEKLNSLSDCFQFINKSNSFKISWVRWRIYRWSNYYDFVSGFFLKATVIHIIKYMCIKILLI